MTGIEKEKNRVLSRLVIPIVGFLTICAPAWPDDLRGGRYSQEQLALARAKDTSRSYYAANIEEEVQRRCIACHSSGQTADQAGARLLFTGSVSDNAEGFETFFDLEDVNSELILGKISGLTSHGGGSPLPVDSPGYHSFSEYLALLSGDDLDDISADDFWDGMVLESRSETLRRAAILLAARLPTADELNLADQGESGLRSALIQMMTGKGFHEFLLTGANDRLLLEGLDFGRAPFTFLDDRTRYPAFGDYRRELPVPDVDFDQSDFEGPTLDIYRFEEGVRFGARRAPLELIAYIVENNRSYKEILTADYTMVNPFTNVVYRSGIEFPPFPTEFGEYDASYANQFLPGRNEGQVLTDDEFFCEDVPMSDCKVVRHSGYVSRPHAGLLTEPAWLSRYPSTDTNRNRARARWTYFHFLGIDIEKSAPRTTDAAALADTNNPTMNNSACTVCHERLDPVAGAYQNFGDSGHYRDQWGGRDSLSDSYKFPQYYGGEPGDTMYVEGDTWYRDMRSPGINANLVVDHGQSLQWLGEAIVEDPRFPIGTVRFWWPAIMGSDVILAPENENDPAYPQRLRAFNAQQALFVRLAEKFKASNYRVKELFAEIVMSDWFRARSFSSEGSDRSTELATVGAGRLLSPEELDRKTEAVFGRRWGRAEREDRWSIEERTHLKAGSEVAISYGGIDSFSIRTRARSLTALMSNVVEAQARDLACQSVIWDMNLSQDTRKLFTSIDRYTSVNTVHTDSVDVQVTEGFMFEEYVFPTTTPSGSYTLSLGVDGQCDRNGCDEVFISEVLAYSGDELVWRAEGQNFPYLSLQAWDGDYYVTGGRDAWIQRAWMRDVLLPLELRDDVDTIVIKASGPGWIDHTNAIPLRLKINTLSNFSDTEQGRLISNQMETLLKNSLGSALDNDSQLKDTLLEVLASRSVESASHGDYFWSEPEGDCNTWSLYSDLPDEEIREKLWDPDGMMRAWTNVLHIIMTHPGFIHDF